MPPEKVKNPSQTGHNTAVIMAEDRMMRKRTRTKKDRHCAKRAVPVFGEENESAVQQAFTRS